MHKYIKKYPLFLIFTLAFLIRLIALNQSFWLDEAISANIIKNYSLINIVTQFSPSDFHPPLFYLLLKAWSYIFGRTPVGLRLFSVTASLLTGLYLYKTAKLLFKQKIALLATIFLLFNPLFIYYSQELRMYALVTLFLSASTFYFFKIQKSTTSKSIFLFNLFILLSFLTFYGSIFYIASFFLLLLIQRKYKLIIKLLPGILLSILLISPLLYRQLFLSKTILKDVTNWSLVLGKSNLKNLLLIPIKFSFGRLTFYPKKLYYLVAGLWTLFIFYRLISTKTSNHLKFIFVFPLIFAFLISFQLPMLQYFRYLYLLPIFCLLLSISIVKTKLLPYLTSLIFILLSLVYLLSPSQHREDWQSLSTSLPPNSDVYMISSFADPLNFYRSDLNILDIRTDLPTNPSTNKLIVIPYGFEIFALDHKALLESLDFTNTQTTSFRGIDLEAWQ